MKRGISLLLAGTLLVGMLAGCNSQKPQVNLDSEPKADTVVAKEGTPVYTDDAQIEIGAYAGPRINQYRFFNGAYGAHPDDPKDGWEGWLTEEAFKDYMDCGFTYVMPEYDGMYDVKTEGTIKDSVYSFEESDLYKYMELAEKMNLPVVIGASFLNTASSTSDYRLTDDLKAYLNEMVENLSKYKMFKGFTLRDEPNIEHAAGFKAIYNYMKELKPDLFEFTSFLPIHTPEPTRLTTNYTGDAVAAYNDYMDAFSDAVGAFTYDSYPLIVDPTSNTTSIGETWFQNLELVAKHATEHGYDAGITMQSCAYGPNGGENTIEHRRTIDTKADAAYQVYTALAYGMKNIVWFTYWQHWMASDGEVFYGAMINYPEKDGNEPIKTDAYYAVQEVNKEIQKFDHVFLKFDWEGTMALAKKDTELSLPMSYISDYKSQRIAKAESTEEAIIGCMKDEEGYDGFMIVNTTDPAENKSNNVTVTFNKATKAIVYVKGEETTVDLTDGSYTFELEAGEGVFAIPLVGDAK